MLIELLGLRVGTARPHPPLARVATALGPAEALWCGEPGAGPGRYHVEWTVDPPLHPGQNTTAAGIHRPGLALHGGLLRLRGRLDAPADGTVLLDLGGESVLLEYRELPGYEWVELTVGVEQVSLHPYQL
ncbi:hypothetical protein [Kitasatospora viridis]|uniref:Uncharacterized protein n=1 Tax=Kitasatospora viridis TaxID=281105 RepID=A0A561T7D6_9ACTN|nr:hypothetical protein [Kitasatospora viridis]TWF83026.1 hypothetical protein FHX73_14509 [Kitasatospora viridis]